MNKPSNKFVFILVLICTRTEPQSKDKIKTSAKRPESRASITVLVNIIGGGGNLPAYPLQKRIEVYSTKARFHKIGKNKSEKNKKKYFKRKAFQISMIYTVLESLTFLNKVR